MNRLTAWLSRNILRRKVHKGIIYHYALDGTLSIEYSKGERRVSRDTGTFCLRMLDKSFMGSNSGNFFPEPLDVLMYQFDDMIGYFNGIGRRYP